MGIDSLLVSSQDTINLPCVSVKAFQLIKSLFLTKSSTLDQFFSFDFFIVGKAVSISNLCITPKEFLSRLGDFGQYCPVSLARTGELVDCSTARSLDLAAEFRGRYYKLENQEKRDEFLAHPEQYVPPLAPRRLPSPDLLPKRRTPLEVKTMFPMRLELQGYCSVTYLDGKLR